MFYSSRYLNKLFLIPSALGSSYLPFTLVFFHECKQLIGGVLSHVTEYSKLIVSSCHRAISNPLDKRN